jgi:hypothetical protein
LGENIQDLVSLIGGPPEIVAFAVDGEKHLIQVPLVAGPGPPMPELICTRLAELAAPLPDGSRGRDHPMGKQEFLYIAVAETEAAVQPGAMADDLGWKAVVFGRVGGSGSVHWSLRTVDP